MPVKRWSFNLIRMAVEKIIAMESDLDSDKISIKKKYPGWFHTQGIFYT